MGLAICATSRRPAKELDGRLTRPGRMDRWLEMLGDAMDCCGNNHVKVGSDCVTQIHHSIFKRKYLKRIWKGLHTRAPESYLRFCLELETFGSC